MEALLATPAQPSSSSLFEYAQEEEEHEIDPLCSVLEMLNFSVVSNNTVQRSKSSNGYNTAGGISNSAEDGELHANYVEGIIEDHDNELVIQNVMLSTDLLISREENVELRKKLDELNSEAERLRRKDAAAENKRQRLMEFTIAIQTEFGSVLKSLSNFVKGAKSGGKQDFDQREFLEFTALLDKLAGNFPLNKLCKWSDTKEYFTQLNDLLTSKSGHVSSTSSPPEVQHRDMENQASVCSSLSSPVTVTSSTLATPPGNNRNGDGPPEVDANEREKLLGNIGPVPPPPPYHHAHPPTITCKNPFSCGLCGVCYPSAIVFMEHVACHHNGCYPCHQLFGTPEILSRHNQQYHPQGVPLPTVPPKSSSSSYLYLGNQNNSFHGDG